MQNFEEFENCLRDSLAHLYDPAYQCPGLLEKVAGAPSPQGWDVVQARLISAIEELKPGPEVPLNARIRRLYQLLHDRYVQELTQVETAQRLGITTRHLRREQNQAVQALARRLWEQWPGPADNVPPVAALPVTAEPEADEADGQAWRSQVREELTVLQQNAPGIVADVPETIAAVLKLERTLALRYGIALREGPVEPGIQAAIHPSALRQVLMPAIEQLLGIMPAGEITVAAAEDAGGAYVHLSVSGSPVAAQELPRAGFISEALVASNGSVEVLTGGNAVTFLVKIPSARKVVVLVVDDNADLVHFYRRYTAKTRYQIEHLTEGSRLFAAIEALKPDIIVLDIMLPDIDGWELLTNLHEYPGTRAIPVIICSVVKQEELAEALGAALYVAKPVRRKQFIEALDTVFNQVLSKVQKTEANNQSIY